PILLDLPADSHNPEVRAIVKGREKLIVYGGGRAELYDLDRDPGELVDLARKEPERLARLRAEYDRAWSAVPLVVPYGGNKLRGGGTARGSPAPR
ncbi:MAG: hypothetical protein FJ104_13620, partial [Deltaproteobacteria bacterium]|nr:hypothetical protein [Deltaproteobacteria bacterium]